MGVETELKLIVAPEALARVPRLAAVRSRKQGRARTQRLVTRYFDTPDLALHRAGMALRLRHTGSGWLQAVKSGGISVGGLQSRGEWEVAVPGAAPVLEAIKATPAFKVLGGARGFRTLAQVFETDFTRVLIPLRFEDGSTAELCVDSGEVRSGGRSSPIHEVELELKQGNAVCLFDMADALSKAVPLRIGHGSKAELGHALARRVSAHGKPVRAARPDVRQDMAWDEAFRCVVGACLSHLQANESGMLAGRDPEFLHQMRIALRRMRSSFAVFRFHLDRAAVAPIEAALRDMGNRLGAARDWDVLVTESLLPFSAAFPEVGAVSALMRKARRVRGVQDRAARDLVASPDYVRGMLRVGRLLASPLAEPQPNAGQTDLDRPAGHDRQAGLQAFAAHILQTRHRRLRKLDANLRRAAQGPAMSSTELHRLRILAKKLRYAAEFFEPLFHGNRARRYIRSLARLQDALGGLNDCANGVRLIDELTPAPGRFTLQQRDAELAAVRFEGWLAAHRSRYLGQFSGRWQTFEEQPRFWKKELPSVDERGAPEAAAGATEVDQSGDERH